MSVAIEVCPKCSYKNTDSFRLCPQCRFPLMLVAGKYKLERELAQGGMGQVYLAQHIHLDYDTERVVKVIKPEVFKTSGMEKRFRREVQVTAALSQRNEHIVRIYDDFGEEKGLGHYYVMEFLRGTPLTDIMPQEEGLPAQTALHIFYQVCKGLSAAHQQKIVHRDLKPDNIYLVQRDGQNFVKVIDFGIARDEADSATKLTKGVLGTPIYMSPEQCNNGLIDARSDQYSLAIILYEMLSARNPYGMDGGQLDSQTMLTMMTAHLMQETIPLTQWRPDLVGLSEVLQRAMSKASAQRYPTLDDFWNAIVRTHPGGLQLPMLGKVSRERNQFGAFSPETGTGTLPYSKQTSNSQGLPTGERILSQSEQTEISQGNRSLWLVVTILMIVVLGVTAFLFQDQLRSGGGGKVSLSSKPLRGKPIKNRVRTEKPRLVALAKKQPVLRRLPLSVPDSSMESIQVEPTRLAPPVVRTRRKHRGHRVRRRTSLRRKTRSHRRVRTRRKYRGHRIRRRTSLRRKTRSHRQVRTRHNAATRDEGPCGAGSPTHRWVVTRMQKPRRARIRIVGCSGCRVKQKSGKYCLWIPKSLKQARVQVSADGHQTCIYRLRSSVRSLRWLLKVEEPDALADENYNCTYRVK